MQYRKLYILIIILCNISCGTTQSDIKKSNLSNAIYKEQIKTWDNKRHLKIFEKNRIRAGWINSIKKMNNDTIYLVENHWFSDEIVPFQHRYYATFWNKKNPKIKHSYSIINNKLKTSTDSPEPNDDLYLLINDWDTIQIKKRSTNSGVFGGDSNTIVTRIINKNDNKQIEVLHFNVFF